MGISEARWPGEADYKSDDFRIIHSEEESRRGLEIILDIRTANCVEKVRCKGDRLLTVKSKEVKRKNGRHRPMHHPSIYADDGT